MRTGKESFTMQELKRTAELIEQGILQGLHLGGQLYWSIDGQSRGDLAIGESRPGVPMTTGSIVPWLSSGKPIGAVAIMQLRERGMLDLDDPVSTYIPEFAANGKEAVTIRNLLSHTGGFRFVELGWPDATWNEIISRLSAAKLERDWTPGARAGYHPLTSWYVLGEIVRRLDGRGYCEYARQEILEPLAMLDSWIAMPGPKYQGYGDRMAVMMDTSRAANPPHRYSSYEAAIQCNPGAGGRGPVRELGYFYEMLLRAGQRSGRRVLQADSVGLMTTRQREGMFDETFKQVIDWGLGLIIDSKRYGAEDLPYGYGRYASNETFGHSGSQSSVAFADPQHRLVVAAMLNGTPGEPKHQARMRVLCESIYEDLKLT
jgi:CubicO group peptidase (beta-lactamase class C family)